MEPAAQQYHNNVFINCPFDDEYKLMFDALVFAVFDCGFRARSTREFPGAAQTRIENIYELIKECQFSIHDISRTELDEHELPRFNMPFELGLFLGAREFGGGEHKNKECLILDREEYRHQKFLSDIAGYDPQAHGDNYETAIRRVRDWLGGRATADNLSWDTLVLVPDGDVMTDRYHRFLDALKMKGVRQEKIIFNNFCTLVYAWIKANPWD